MPSQLGSYRFIVPAFANFAASPTDWITVTPNGPRVVGITNVTFFGTCPTPTTLDILLLRRSALNTGGTLTSVAATQLEEISVPTNTLVQVYTVNPTILGTLVGVGFDAIKLNLGPAGGAGFASVDFGGNRGVPAVRLRTTTHQFAINLGLNGSLPAGTSISCRIEGYEEQ
jgi:hypothetical protein